MNTTALVLLFSTVAPAAQAARLHAPTCPMTNTGKGRRGFVRSMPATDEAIADLNERGFIVKRCKCCKET